IESLLWPSWPINFHNRWITFWGARQDEELVIESLQNAIRLRQPPSGLIHHSGRGGQYASKRYRVILRRASMRQSILCADNCYDNAFMESCFGTIKTELPLEDDGTDAVVPLSNTAGFSWANLARLIRNKTKGIANDRIKSPRAPNQIEHDYSFNLQERKRERNVLQRSNRPKLPGRRKLEADTLISP
ncbi:MAG: hypothetical protein AAFX06_33415, partial [Planctomycetota bacterium]